MFLLCGVTTGIGEEAGIAREQMMKKINKNNIIIDFSPLPQNENQWRRVNVCGKMLT